MVRSKKNGVAPAAGDKKKGSLNLWKGGAIDAGDTRAIAAPAAKKSSKSISKKKPESRDEENTGVVVGVDGGGDEGSTGGTNGSQAKSNRDILRDQVMKQEEGRTALSLALLEQREDIADLIISIDGADVNAPDTIVRESRGMRMVAKFIFTMFFSRPNYYYSFNGSRSVLLDLGSSTQKLAFRGANINAVDKVGMTPLMLACRLGHESMVDMLVNVLGAEIDPADNAGWTCLFYATYHNESSIVQHLLMHGAAIDQKDQRGMTAVDWGEHMGLGETCAIFSSFESQLAL